MGVTKISEKELREELEAGLTVKRENDPCGVYRKNTLEVIAMIERNQGIGV